MGFTRFMAMAVAACACSPAPGDPILPDADRIFQAECPVPPPTTGGDTFTAIYNDIMSPKGVARCQDSACHGGSSEQAGLAMKTGKDGAYEGMKAFGLIQVDATGANVSPLITVVSAPFASTGKPRMPRELCGNRLLNAAEVERLKAWGAKGAKND